jgi:DNA-3-methyladenine glycosylase I
MRISVQDGAGRLFQPLAEGERFMTQVDGKRRCEWVGTDELMKAYHDTEWGVPVHDDRKLFEFLVLEGMQAGLSWKTILYKRENFRRAFHGFDFCRVACYKDHDILRLLADASVIRNRLKIMAAVNNAQRFLEVREEFGTFERYIWEFVSSRPCRKPFRRFSDVPARTALSDKISEDLKRRGFKFVGSTIVYAHMQATGMVNDHLADCFRRRQVSPG